MVLGYSQFKEQCARRRQEARVESSRVQAVIGKLLAEQQRQIEGWEGRLGAFERHVQGAGVAVDAVVQQVEVLSKEIAQLQHTKCFLTTTVAIETAKYDPQTASD